MVYLIFKFLIYKDLMKKLNTIKNELSKNTINIINELNQLNENQNF